MCDDVKWLHPGQSAYILASGNKIGVIGVIHPSVLKTFQIKAKVPIVFELDLDVLVNKKYLVLKKFLNIHLYQEIYHS